MAIDLELIDMYGSYFAEKREEFPNEAPSFRPHRFGFADPWLESLTKLFLAMPQDYLRQHREMIRDLAERIREKRTYYFFLDALRAVEKRFNLPFPLNIYELKEIPPRTTIASFLMTELLLVWALMEKDGRLLICVRNGFQRKHFSLPEDPYYRRKAITAIGHHVLAALPFITPEHLDLIPDKFGPLHEIDSSIQLPIFGRTIEEVLADARARQRYVVGSEGQLVRWKKRAYDLKEMLVKAIDGVVVTKALTSAGETLAFLDLETARGLDFVIHQEGPQNPLALALSAAYHKLVTVKEVRARRETNLEIPTVKAEAEKPELVEEGPTVIYIPRTIVVERAGIGKTRAVLSRWPIHHESPIDHARHLKRGEMSAEQRQRVEEFERERGVNVLDWLPPGWTYVLPHDWREKKRKVVYLAATVEPQLSQKKVS